MLEKPDIPDARIIECLRDHYAVWTSQLNFLPLGADRGTAVYQAAGASMDYFVKLRRGPFDETNVAVPKLLRDGGIVQVMAPIANRHGQLWTPVEQFHLILYPFVEGENGFDRDLSAQNWIELGQALRRVHTASLPPPLAQRIPRETFSPFWRAKVSEYQALVETVTPVDPIAAELAELMRERKAELSALVYHAYRLAQGLQERSLTTVLCHADIHVGNTLVTPDGRLYIVDWDTLLLAPKERDLMFMGMGLGRRDGYTDDEQAALFYQGYGECDVDPAALAYYRCERIVQDAFEYCEQILLTAGEQADRREGLRQFRSQFEPDRVVARALQSVAAVL